jgi:hypothetical protein
VNLKLSALGEAMLEEQFIQRKVQGILGLGPAMWRRIIEYTPTERAIDGDRLVHGRIDRRRLEGVQQTRPPPMHAPHRTGIEEEVVRTGRGDRIGDEVEMDIASSHAGEPVPCGRQ